jgi:NTP pyrophosphatase (non-canonical NTP hydrolase)
MMYLGEKYDVIQIMNGLKQLAEELQDYAWYLFLIARLADQPSLAPDPAR